MKIGLVRRGYSSSGGAEAYLHRFAEAAVAAGHEVVLFSEQWPQAAWPFALVPVPSSSPLGFADALQALRPREQCDFLFSLERVWTCDAYRAGDGVHAAWLERRAQFEPVWRGLWRFFSRKHRETLAIERRLFGPDGARTVIANSALVKAQIGQAFRYPAERIHVVHNGLPPLLPTPEARAAVRRQLGIKESDYVLLFAGSGWERKGLRYALAAVEALAKPAVLLVAGRGQRRGLPASARACFLGPRNDIPALLAASDAFLLPTLYDPFSNACLEALAAGLPVITTRHNGFAEIIEPGVEGEILDDPRDTRALAAALEAWRDPERRAGVRPRLLALAARFSIAENVRQTLAIIAGGAMGYD